MATEIKVATVRLVAALSYLGKATGIENVAGKGLASQLVRRLVAEFVGRHYNKGLFNYAVRKLQGR